METNKSETRNIVRAYADQNRSLIRVGSAILLMFLAFSASERFSVIASGGIGEGVVSIHQGYELGFKVSLVTLGVYLLIKDLIINAMSNKQSINRKEP